METNVWDQAATLAQKIADIAWNLKHYPEPGEGPAPLVVAHRGALDVHPENSMQAFLAARASGAWAIEFDIQFCKDGVPIILHDPNFSRTHGQDVKACDIVSASLKNYSPAVPTLKEVLALKGLHFMIEVKSRLTDEQLEKLADTLSPLLPVTHYHLLSLNPDFVRISEATPARAWFLVGEVNLKPLIDLSLRHGYAGVAGHYLTMTKTQIGLLHSANQKAGVGFVPSRNLWRRAWARGADWVFTNHISRLKSSR
ncbi:MAG TPA: glycerophosphodiester phosphodiesterase [Bdellovibrionales bacterium]|nr:glycerophosphodiester phosphodiesterase [Bdellovibrionales bacterium]